MYMGYICAPYLLLWNDGRQGKGSNCFSASCLKRWKSLYFVSYTLGIIKWIVHSQISWLKCVMLIKVTQNPTLTFMNLVCLYDRHMEMMKLLYGRHCSLKKISSLDGWKVKSRMLWRQSAQGSYIAHSDHHPGWSRSQMFLIRPPGDLICPRL